MERASRARALPLGDARRGRHLHPGVPHQDRHPQHPFLVQWYTAVELEYFVDTTTLFVIELILIGWAEGRRWAAAESRERRERERESETRENSGVPTNWAITASLGTRRRRLQPQVDTLKLRAAAVLDKNRPPAPHGGRGALPSAGGSPSDLLFLAGGGGARSPVPLSLLQLFFFFFLFLYK
ncbi:hypothetical protein Cni_G11082 [Canna indica]|uniref:Uncharacterized protein n=1 Tax=Canna indica TaxID=4628 RepID=A0AAQ3K7Y4_9LILI|nr:hypothetical protein Cni_G11082 [Canna indica]